jgi:hypothetical protein
MTGGLTLAYDHDVGQVVLEGLPTGAAGGAGLAPVPGLHLVFDRADGHLARLTVDTGEPADPADLGEETFAVLTSLLGRGAIDAVRRAARRPAPQRRLVPEPGPCAVLSRLARLDAARSNSPVPAASPRWAAEAAVLAGRAGLHARGRAEALQAAAQPAGCAGKPGQPGVLCGRRPSPAFPGLQWAFDPRLVPEGVFLPGLSPLSDLVVHRGDRYDRVVVEAQLAPGAGCSALGRCRVRLVDPGTRRILACGAFIEECARARAELLLPLPVDELGEAWLEVVDDEHRPVQSTRLRQRRRALRWAGAALRAEQRPQGVAPSFTDADWAALADHAWEQCHRDWEAAGDADRAYLAAMRLAAADPWARVPQAPSAWAATLASRLPLREPAYLAEALGR